MKRALVLFLAVSGLSALLGILGVFVLFGTGWALIAASGVLSAAAEAIRRGLSANV